MNLNDTSNVFQLMQLNVQGLTRRKFLEFELFLDEHLSYDLLCLSEHWLSADEYESFRHNAWHVASFFARSNKIRGGSLILCKDQEYEVVQEVNDLSTECICEISALKRRNITVLNVYRPPKGNFDDFLTIIDRALCLVKSDVVVTGDFNCLFQTDESSADANALSLVELLSTHGFVQNVFSGTRASNCIDNTFTNFSENQVEIGVNPVEFSDHKATQCNFHVVNPNLKRSFTSLKCRLLTMEGFSVFHTNLGGIDVSFLSDDSLNANMCFKIFSSIFVNIFEMSFPERTMKGKSNDAGVKWFNGGLRLMREKLRLINEMYLKFKTEDLKRARSLLSKEYKSSLRQAKTKANDKFIFKSDNPVRNMWKLINAKRENKCKESNSISANSYSNFFSSIPRKILESLPPTNSNPLHLMPNKINMNLKFKFREVSLIEVRDIIDGLKYSKTTDYSGLSVALIKKNINTLVSPLTKLINKCINERIFPDCLKLAKIIPVYKRGGKNIVENYRPISILPVFSKVVEKALYFQIMEYFESNMLFSNKQFGFRKHKKTLDAVYQFLTFTLECFEKGYHSLSLFLDLSKAFDCVGQSVLLEKMKRYGFELESLDLMRSYFANRRQRVFSQGMWSQWESVNVGVPQGSILGPLMFLIFVNDFSDYMSDFDHLLWADDSSIMVGGRDMSAVCEDVQIAELRAKKWFNTNGLCCNDDKTEYLLFTLRRIADESLMGSSRFLGVHMDSKLTWNVHIENISTKISKNIFVLRRLVGSVSLPVLRGAYSALCESHMRYCVILWGHSSGRERIFRLQRKAVRLMANLGYRDDCEAAFRSLRILTFPSLFIYECLKYVHVNKKTFNCNIDFHDHNTRRANDIRSDYVRLKKSHVGPAFLGHKLFNKLSSSTRNLPEKMFLRTIREFLIEKAFYSVASFLSATIEL